MARNAHLKRVLTSIDPNPKLSFWRLILANHLDVSVLEWCKIFGSNAEATHWKNVVPASDHDRFRMEMLQTLDLSKEEWESYWESMKIYRDRQVAHFNEFPPSANYPLLDNALSSGYYYYKYLIEQLRKMGENRFPDDLEVYCNEFTHQAQEVAKRAIDATANISEKVG